MTKNNVLLLGMNYDNVIVVPRIENGNDRDNEQPDHSPFSIRGTTIASS